jgi:sulfur carrier protein
MRILANARDYQVEPHMSVGEFIRSRGLNPRFVVVELNGEPVERERYEVVTLAEGDRLELVRAVAGG